MAGQFANSPFGFFQGQSVNQLAPINPATGLPNELNSAMGSMANQMFSKASAGGSLQGMNSPENTAGVVGSSLNNIGQFLTPYVLDYQKYRQQLPEQLMASRLGFLQNTLGSMGAGLGSQSSYKGSSFNLDTGLSANAGSGGGGGMSSSCWIAGVLYGEGSMEQLAIRAFLGQQTSPFWNVINRLYTKFGERVAEFIKPRPWAQTMFVVPFNWLLKKAIHG
jgi:hypothetical protein